MHSPTKFLKSLLINRWSGLIGFAIGIGLLSHVTTYFSITGILQPAGSKLFSREVGVLAAIGALLLSLYRFVYLRPELFLDVDLNNGTYLKRQEGDGYTANISIYLVNAGNRYAEDVQLTFALDAFKFETDLDTTEHPSESYEINTTTMDSRSGRRIGFMGGGRRHDIFFENVVYERDIHKLYYGKAIFSSEQTHEIKYTIACRTHGLRQGQITIEMEDGELAATRAYPTVWRQLKAYLWWSPDLKRTQRVENIDDVDTQVNTQ
ncbi:hypothetical protein [Natrinema gelatinilyticum]|uniref:hypothetical protein n=1 Tax=Natrinema gelatinilyticum TaxID=2961571 RepID=UPI0020C37801|nr:hypothetical protein [Natrinema gelatinilyticum]